MSFEPTEMSTPGGTGHATSVRRHTSRLAIIALALNIPCFFPPATLLAAVVGVVALLRIRRDAQRSGATLAVASTIIGVALTAVSTPFWWSTIRLARTGPQEALRAGFAGDAAGLREAFTGPGGRATDEAVLEFIGDLRARYGAFEQARVHPLASPPPGRRGSWTVPYELRFERGTTRGDVVIVTTDPDTGRSLLRFALLVIDPEGAAPISYPAATAARPDTRP